VKGERNMALNVVKATEVKERAITYKSADGQDISLSPDIVKRYLVQGKSELVTMQELMYFLNICRARRLNPLVKDCYLIKYSENEGAAIITSVDFFRKRARAQKDCKGWKKGCIVKCKDGTIKDTYGLVLPEETLVGGWFEAHPEGWLESFRIEVNLSGYLKKTGKGELTRFWSKENQPTMIAKVAEAQGLRTLWPDEFQSLFTEEEVKKEDGPFIDVTPEKEEKTPPDPEKIKAFDDAMKGEDQERLGAYHRVCADHFKITVDEVKAGAADIKAFTAQFEKWAKMQGQKEKVETDVPEYIACPNLNDEMVMRSKCEGCKHREGCPAWT